MTYIHFQNRSNSTISNTPHTKEKISTTQQHLQNMSRRNTRHQNMRSQNMSLNMKPQNMKHMVRSTKQPPTKHQQPQVTSRQHPIISQPPRSMLQLSHLTNLQKQLHIKFQKQQHIR